VIDGSTLHMAFRLRQMDASSRERMLMAGVGVLHLVSGAAVVMSGAGCGRQVVQYMLVLV